jgi:hypothetical protein
MPAVNATVPGSAELLAAIAFPAFSPGSAFPASSASKASISLISLKGVSAFSAAAATRTILAFPSASVFLAALALFILAESEYCRTFYQPASQISRS